jgi:hypothetical protein
VQRDIANIDSTGDTQRILDLARFVDRQAKTTLLMYDSTSDLPNLLDDTADTMQLAYVANQRRIYVNQGTWKPMTQFGPPVASQAQGNNFGYSAGGHNGPPSFTAYNTIDKFPFTSDGNATDVGDMTNTNQLGWAGQSSTTSGYATGAGPGLTNVIDKFPFSSDTNAADVGDLSVARYAAAGQSSTTDGYTSGGYVTSPVLTDYNVIDKFPFSSDGTASDVGNLTVARRLPAGQSSETHGYTSAGDNPSPGFLNTIDKFSFSVDENASDVGDLTLAKYAGSGQNSKYYGYFSRGWGPIYTNTVEKFPFASDANSTQISGLATTTSGFYPTGQSSFNDGYVSGGSAYPPPSSVTTNVINRFPFASEDAVTDVGDLTVARRGLSGQQY